MQTWTFDPHSLQNKRTYRVTRNPEARSSHVQRGALGVLARLQNSETPRSQPETSRSVHSQREEGSVRGIRPIRRQPGRSLCGPLASDPAAVFASASQMCLNLIFCCLR